MFLLPELQKKVDEYELKISELQIELGNRDQVEQERMEKLEQSRRDEKERVMKQKQEWEARMLGIGKCSLTHVGEDCNHGNGNHGDQEYVVDMISR